SAAAHAKVPAMRLAIADATLDDPPDAPARPIEQLATAVADAEELHVATDYAAAGELLPGLLEELHVAAAVGDEKSRQEALALLVRACYSAGVVLRYLGYPDLALLTAQRAAEAAARVPDDPVTVGFAAWTRAWAIAPPTGRRRALSIARRGLDELDGHLGSSADRRVWPVYGMLHLVAAFTSGVWDRDDLVAEHLRAAEQLAARTGETRDLTLFFGPTNVAAWRVAIAVERGEGGRVLELAADIHPEVMASPSRQGAYWTDIGRGLATIRGREGEAEAALRRADEIAPQRFRSDPAARDTVDHMYTTARRRAVSRDLQCLANRFSLGNHRGYQPAGSKYLDRR
ncbi:MAG: hypothetical protein ACJ786_38825, partial [Catenulispora sp.]